MFRSGKYYLFKKTNNEFFLYGRDGLGVSYCPLDDAETARAILTDYDIIAAQRIMCGAFTHIARKWERETGLHICTEHTGKMKTIYSFSTSCVKNKYCIARMKNTRLICSECFSNAMHDQYKDLAKLLAHNTDIITREIFPIDFFPIVYVPFFRLESFGDLNNETQCINYFHFCRRNPKTTFVLWSKNPHIIARAIEREEKPENLIIIYSSPVVNSAIDYDMIKARFPFIDRVFTVYDKEYIIKNNIDINCGARDCMKCTKCYINGNGIKNLFESLKGKGGY